MAGIRGFLETSFSDWPGRVCAVLFLGGCNFRCPFCHNHPLVEGWEELPEILLDDLLPALRRRQKWLGGVCISGGEPTLDPGLPDLARRLKKEGFAVKLDTNGSRPEVLAALLGEELLDMVAMDVKTVLEQEAYDRVTGVAAPLDRIRAAVELLRKTTVAREFRMTVLPRFHDRRTVQAWSEHLRRGSITPTRLTLQGFNSRSTLDPGFAAEPPFQPDILEGLRRAVYPFDSAVEKKDQMMS